MTLEEAYDEFMGELQIQYQEDKVLAAECSHCVRSKLPPKREDPGRFNVPCCISKAKERALCDLGSSISLIPLSFAKKWNVGKLTTNEAMDLILADQSTLNPSGIIKDVLVKIKDLVFPFDFVIIDIEEDADIPIIFGRPFLATSRALIDMEREELTLRMGAQERLIKVHKDEGDWCFKIDVRDKPENVPQAAGWKMKVHLEELEENMSQLTMEKEPLSPDLSYQMKLLNIKENKALWVRRWGKNRKVATRSKFGVNKEPVKIPSRKNLKVRFRKIIDKDSRS
ncbi:hypothetical protein A2U01_0015603 [Trifolium medium]|uniref:Uncharacterized protein n=1 Tax=Trifolium medium TaxID=97028 RepID=A0A392N495_9FABA|nr:hypothetical protein [Trifolium medium]